MLSAGIGHLCLAAQRRRSASDVCPGELQTDEATWPCRLRDRVSASLAPAVCPYLLTTLVSQDRESRRLLLPQLCVQLPLASWNPSLALCSPSLGLVSLPTPGTASTLTFVFFSLIYSAQEQVLQSASWFWELHHLHPQCGPLPVGSEGHRAELPTLGLSSFY